jgi:cytochrome c-type biogenesis protein CcmH/NrfG
MPKKQAKPPIMMKPPSILLAVVVFAAGFFAGVGITVYKTRSSNISVSAEKQEIDYAKKERMLTAEVQRDPENTVAWIQLGHVYFDQNQYVKAIGAYEKALEKNPKNADVLTDLGVMYRRNGEPRKAVTKFDEAIAVDFEHETARLNKGIVLMHDLKDREGAIKAWENLLEINPVAMAGEVQSVDQMIKHYQEGHDKN